MERPYEIEDPIEYDPVDDRHEKELRDERFTGRKATAVIDEPRGCAHCVFHWYRWNSPGWAKPSEMLNWHNEPGTACIGCTLSHQGTLTVVDWDDKEYKPDWCPLVPVEEGA